MPRPVALFVCGLGTALILAGLYLSRLGRETRGFTHTRGRVVASEVEELPAPAEEGGPRSRAVVRYTYEARGRTWESEQISVGSPRGAEPADAREARRLAARHPAGSEVDVWFDPSDPRRSVLVRSVPRASVFVAIAVGLALVGMGLFGLARR